MDQKLRFLIPIALLAVLVSLAIPGCSNSARKAAATTIPDVTGLTFEQAQVKLQEAGLDVGDKQEQYSDTPSGTVMSITPAPGAELAKGQQVVMVISRGPETIFIPSLIGMAEADATATLSSLGLHCEVGRDYNERVDAGLVCGMDPGANSSVTPGSKVTLRVSQGSAYTTCTTCGGQGEITSTEACPVCQGTGTCYT